VGCYDNNKVKKEGFELTQAAKDLDQETKGSLTKLLNVLVHY